MELKDVLAAVPGLNKRLVYYLEALDFIRPVRLPKERIDRREYSPWDLRRLRRFWTYYQRGYSVRAAAESVERAARSSAYAIVPVPARRLGSALECLRCLDQVQEAAVVYGKSADLILRMSAGDDRDVYDVLDRLFEVAGVSGVPRIYRVVGEDSFEPVLEQIRPGPAWPEGHPAPPARVGTAAEAGFQPPVPTLAGVRGALRARPGQELVHRAPDNHDDVAQGHEGSPEGVMLAYVLIASPPKQVAALIEELRRFPGVVEAAALYGESDAIAKIQVATQGELDDLVMNRIHALPSVESTRTFIAVGGMRWERRASEAGDE